MSPTTIDFNLQGYIYQQGIERLADGFQWASQSLQEQVNILKKKLSSYHESVANGGERIGEWDAEEGYTLWEQDQIYDMEIENAETSLADLRKAYVLAIYHQWERSARNWTRSGPKSDHKHLVRKVREAGYAVDKRIDALRDLANVLKHNNEKWGLALQSSWPSVVGAYATARSIDWYNVVTLEDADVRTACDIVRGSGPTATSLPRPPTLTAAPSP